MRSSMHLVLAFVLLALIVQQSLQCTCDWRWRQVDGENVPNTLCYEDGEYIVFKLDKKERIPGRSGYDEIDGRMHFDVTVSKYITKAAGEQVLPEGRKVTLDAPIGSSLCGYIDFKPGVTHVLSIHGGLKDKINFNACSFYSREPEVSNVQLRLMSGKLTCPKDTDPMLGHF